MSKGTIITIVIVVVLVAGGLVYWYAMPGSSYAPSSSPSAYQTPPVATTTPTPVATTSEQVQPTSTAAKTATVTYTDNGFSPSTVTIAKGGTVTFKNAASDAVRVASNPHPLHTGYPTTGGCVGSTFDSCHNIAPGGSWSFTFTFAGSWGYHNHLNPGEGGTVVVQ